MSKRNPPPLSPRSTRPPIQNLQPKVSEKPPPPNPTKQTSPSNPSEKAPPLNNPEKTPPPNPPNQQPSSNPAEKPPPAEAPIPSTLALRSSRVWEPKPPKNFRRRHIASVYVFHAVLTLFAVAQLVALLWYKIDFMQAMGGMVSSLLCLLLALAVLLILALVKIANTCPVNYLLAVVVVELVVLFVNCHQWTKLTLVWMGGVLAIVLVVNLLLYAIGIFAPMKFLPGVLAVMIIGFIFIVVVITIIATVYLNGNRYLMRYVSMLSLCYECVIVVFTVTVVHQRRFDYLALGDHVLHSTILSSGFVYMAHAVAIVVGFGEYLVERM